jgi:hypothetical protein
MQKSKLLGLLISRVPEERERELLLQHFSEHAWVLLGCIVHSTSIMIFILHLFLLSLSNVLTTRGRIVLAFLLACRYLSLQTSPYLKPIVSVRNRL